jgi:hypothetical protein
MSFVAVKCEAAQASTAIYRMRDLLDRQRTQHIDALRGQLAEYGVVAAKGPANPSTVVMISSISVWCCHAVPCGYHCAQCWEPCHAADAPRYPRAGRFAAPWSCSLWRRSRQHCK